MSPVTVIIIIVQVALDGAATTDKIVVPRLLDERSDDGRHVVVIDDSLTLRLEKSSVMAEQIMISGFGDIDTGPKVIESWQYEKDLYQDPDNMASLMMHVGKQGLELTGMLTPSLKIAPLPVTGRNREGTGVPHKVDLIERASWNITREMEHKEARVLESVLTEERQTATIITSVFPEVVVVLDRVHNSVYDKSKLIGYMIILFNAVNLRYRYFTAPSVKFRVVGLHLLTPEEDVFFMGSSLQYANADATTKLFAQEAHRTKKYGSPDMFIIVIGRDLLVPSGGTFQDMAGLAFVGEICGPMNVGIAEDTAGTYKGVHVVAHEAAHLLGVVHDGQGPVPSIPGHPGALRPECTWEQGYMMSYVDGGIKFHHFSPCAQAQIFVTLSHRSQKCFFPVKYNASRHPKQPRGDCIMNIRTLLRTDFPVQLTRSACKPFALKLILRADEQ